MLKILSSNKLYTILVVGLLLRLIGTAYGYPYVFHIDEPAVVRSALGLRYSTDIGHFDWPHFPFYLNFIFYFIFIKVRGAIQIMGLRDFFENFFPVLWSDPFVFYFISRLINGIFGALTIIPVYLLAKSIFSRRVGLIAAIILALMPYHVYISHVAVPDTLLLFFISWAIYYSYKFSESFSYKHIILSAVMFGISSGIKYNAIVLAVILPLFVWHKLKLSDELNSKNIIKLLPKFFIFGLISLFTLLATTPTIISDWDVFWSYESGKGFLWQLKTNSGPLGLTDYFPALLKQLYKIFIDTGFISFPLAIYSAYRASKLNKEKANIYILLGVTIAFILFTARYSRATSHYFLPIYATLIPLIAWGINSLINIFNTRKILDCILGLFFVLAAYNTILFLRADTRNLALKYYEEANNKDGRTYVEGGDLVEADIVNNLGMKRAKNIEEINENDVILSQTMIENNDKIVLVESIDNFFRKGPIIYVYKKAS